MTDKELSDMAMELAVQGLTTSSAQKLFRFAFSCRALLTRLSGDQGVDDVQPLRDEALRLLTNESR